MNAMPFEANQYLQKLFTEAGYLVFYETKDGSQVDDECADNMVINWEDKLDDADDGADAANGDDG